MVNCSCDKTCDIINCSWGKTCDIVNCPSGKTFDIFNCPCRKVNSPGIQTFQFPNGSLSINISEYDGIDFVSSKSRTVLNIFI